MSMTEAERQRARRKKMYNAGYKLMSIWVPREFEKETTKMERRIFLRRIESLTAGWTEKKLSKLFNELLKIVKEKVKEDKKLI